MDGRTNRRTEQKDFLIFFLLDSFSDLRKSDSRNSSGQEQKVFYATRATRGYKKKLDFIENSGKNLENPNFWFFSDL